MCLRSTLAISYFTNNILLSRLDLSIIYLYNRKNRIATPIPNTTLSEKLATADTEILRHVTLSRSNSDSVFSRCLAAWAIGTESAFGVGRPRCPKICLLARSPSRLGRSVAT